MQRSFDWSEHSSREIRGLTCYVGTCKGHLTDQNILSERSKALHSHTMLEHAEVIWLIRTFFQRNQRNCTCILCQNIRRSFNWSEHSSWEIRGTALTSYVRTCKGHLTDQNILLEKSEALHWHTMLEHTKVIWLIRTFFRGTALTYYVGTCKDHLTDKNILPEKSEALHWHTILEHAKVIWLIRTFFWRNQRHCTHILCWKIGRASCRERVSV